VDDGSIKALLRNGNWSLSFAGVLAYVFAAVTYALPIVGPAIVIALLGLAFERKQLVMPMFVIVFALYVAWAAAGIGSSYQQQETVDQTIVLAKVVLIAFVLVNVTRDGWRVRMFSIFFLACFALYPARGTLVNYFLAGYTWFGRALWNYIYNNSNDLAALVFFPLSLSVATLLTEKKGFLRHCALVGVGILPLIILLTQSRGALIALVVSGLLFYISYAKGKRVKSLLWAAAVSIVIIPFVPKSAWERFSGMKALTSTSTVAQADPEGSAEARYNIWRVARVIIRENPVSGVGLGAYTYVHNITAPRVGVPDAALGKRDTHSTYLNVAAETGFPGLVLFVVMILTVAVPAERMRRRVRGTPRSGQLLALELGLLGFLLAGVFGSFAKLSFLYVQLATLWAVSALAREESTAGLPVERSATQPAVPRRSAVVARRV
jgi:O-antigen ligase